MKTTALEDLRDQHRGLVSAIKQTKADIDKAAEHLAERQDHLAHLHSKARDTAIAIAALEQAPPEKEAKNVTRLRP